MGQRMCAGRPRRRPPGGDNDGPVTPRQPHPGPHASTPTPAPAPGEAAAPAAGAATPPAAAARAPAAYLSMPTGMSVYVSVLGSGGEPEGPALCIDAGPGWSVADLCHAAAAAAGAPGGAVGARLRLSDELLPPGSTLADVGLGAEAAVTLIFPLALPKWGIYESGMAPGEDGRLATLKASGWQAARTDGFCAGGPARVWCVEIVEPAASANICVGVCRAGVDVNIYPRDAKRGMWFFMFCWGAALYYDGERADPEAGHRPPPRAGARLCVALREGRRLLFLLNGEALAPAAELSLVDPMPYHFYVSLYQSGAAVRFAEPTRAEADALYAAA